MKVATSNRGRHVTWEEWAMSGNDARYDADSAVLVAAKQKAALQEPLHATPLAAVLFPAPLRRVRYSSR